MDSLEKKARALRSDINCMPLSNPFHNEALTEELAEYIPKHILYKLPNSPQITCDDILALNFKPRDHHPDLKSMKTACDEQTRFLKAMEASEAVQRLCAS